jgi:transposase
MPLNEANRGKIIGMVEAGVGVTAIARELEVDRSTIYRWIKRYREGDQTLKTRPKSGRPRCTTRHQDEEVQQYSLDQPLLAGGAAVIKRQLRMDCSSSTIRRRLHEAGIHNYRPAIKPMINEEHREARLEFAQAYAEMSQAYWDLAIFSDEKTFRSDQHGKVQLWRPRNSR